MQETGLNVFEDVEILGISAQSIYLFYNIIDVLNLTLTKKMSLIATSKYDLLSS